MDLDARLENVAVLGAAGKMGSGIALLLAQEMAKQRIASGGDKSCVLTLMDVDQSALTGLMSYLRAQLTKLGEKSTIALRASYADRADLVENGDIINAFVEEALSFCRPTTSLDAIKGANLVFEAIIEDKNIKLDVLKKIDALCPDAYYLTNTSSIPIGVIDKGVPLNGRIIGYHFYNPPAVQKLLELISPEGVKPELVEVGVELAGKLRKKVFLANDIAGFIGNGHFMRDILHATSEVKKLAQEAGEAEAAYMMNRVSQEFMIRPMGIFQLIDYVGIDVCRFIMNVMTEHIEGETLSDDLLNRMADAGVMGGQHADGSQKDGFLKYERGRPAGIYDLKKGGYVMFADGDWAAALDSKLGSLPDGHAPWRALLMDPTKDEKLEVYFGNLAKSGALGSNLAKAYLVRSREIGEKLVSDGVANSVDDVNGVMMNGFYHLYGPINKHVDLMVDAVR